MVGGPSTPTPGRARGLLRPLPGAGAWRVSGGSVQPRFPPRVPRLSPPQGWMELGCQGLLWGGGPCPGLWPTFSWWLPGLRCTRQLPTPKEAVVPGLTAPAGHGRRPGDLCSGRRTGWAKLGRGCLATARPHTPRRAAALPPVPSALHVLADPGYPVEGAEGKGLSRTSVHPPALTALRGEPRLGTRCQ